MEILDTNSTQYIKVKLSPGESETLLINAKKIKNGPGSYIVENCLINQIILGIAPKYEVADELIFHDNLKKYQIADVLKMCSRDHICNFNRMGYGKTIEAIRAMRELRIKNAVIVAPKSVLLQWVNQIKIWYPEMKDHVGIYGEKFVPKSDRIVVVNYERLIQETALQRFKKFRWDLIVVDEAHRIKNRKSKRTMSVKSIPAQRKWAMTGTPITRKVDDLWSILNFLGEYYSSKSYWNFVNYFCNIKQGFFGLEITGLTDDIKRIEVLHQLLDIAAITNPNLQLTPGKHVEKINLQMPPAQLKLYRDAKNLVLDELPDSMTIPNGAVLVTRLMQITSNPQQFGCRDAGIKFEYIRDIMDDNPDTKFVVFSKFATTCLDLQSYLFRYGLKSVLYVGSMDAVDRFTNIQQFLNDNKTQAIIGTIGAMGEGVDGLQTVCNNVIFIDRDFSPEMVAQAEDRVNRMGQTQPVFVQYLQCAKTYDMHVDKVNLKKTEDIRRALQDES